jgi:hypothetical protein
MATNATQVQPDDAKRKRTRSPEHPSVNLEAALKRAKQFYDVEQRNAVSLNTAIKDWGYEPKSSGGLQTVATLISFGLLKDEGAGDKRKLQLTQLALRILLDQRPDSTERAALIKQAALMPKIHKQLWDKWGASRPSDAEVRHVLAVEWEPPFNDKSVDGFIKEYAETLRFAKLDQSDESVTEATQEDKGNAGPAYTPKVGDYVQWDQGGILQLPEPTRVRAITPDGKFVMLEGSNTGVPVNELIPEQAPAGVPGVPTPAVDFRPQATTGRMQKDIFSLKEGEVVLFWPSPLSEESVQDVTDWLDIVKRKFARAVPAKDAEKP